MVTAESCNELVITLTNDTRKAKVSTICCRSVILKYPKEGFTDQQVEEDPEENQASYPIAEVYETVVGSENELKTTPMEALE